METNNSKIIEINIKELFHAVLKRLWIIILISILCAAGAGYYSKNYITPYYTSYAKLYIINKQEGQMLTLLDLQTGLTLAKDYVILVKSRPVADEVIQRLNLPMSSDQLCSLINVYTHEETRVLEISVTYFDQQMVKKIVDTVAEVSSERMVSIMGMEKVNVVEDGSIPYGPSGPDIKRNIMLAGCAGAFVTGSLVILLYFLDDTIKTSEDIEKHLGLTTLGYIPVEEIQKKKKSKNKNKGKKAA